MIDDILKELEFNEGKLPEDALRKAIECREEITPALIRVIDDTRESAYERAGQPDFMGHLAAMYLLAQFREKSAYRPIIKLVSLPDDLPYHLAGDFLVDDLPRVLASVSGGDIFHIKRLIEDPTVDPMVRGAGLRALIVLLTAGLVSRAEVVSYFRSLFHGKLEREYSDVWDELIWACVDIHPQEFEQDIMTCRSDGPGYEFLTEDDEIAHALQEDKQGWLERLRQKPYYSMVDDAVTDVAWCYRPFDTRDFYDDEEFDEGEDWEDDYDEDWEGEDDFTVYPGKSALGEASDSEVSRSTEPFEQAPKWLRKIGRNEPCPCGSGKKFKKCCGDPKLQDRN